MTAFANNHDTHALSTALMEGAPILLLEHLSLMYIPTIHSDVSCRFLSIAEIP